MRIRLSSTFAVGLAGLVAASCADTADTGTTAQHAGTCPITITSVNQSLVVTAATHPGLAGRFTFARVMQQIFDTGGGAPSQDKLTLYRQWMSSYAQPACSAPAVDPHGYGLQCPRPAETLLAGVDPYNANDRAPFTAVALFNRFDLTPQTGETCGEHRIVFAVPPSGPNLDRAFLIFEAALPNPRPDLGVDGCYAVARFWQSLSGLTAADRLAQLEAFYFNGLVEPVTGERIGPVVTAQNYGLAVRTGFTIGDPIGIDPQPVPVEETARVRADQLAEIGGRVLTDHAQPDGAVLRYGGTSRFGQVRTNMFVNNAEWNLREFKMLSDCTGPTRGCTLSFEHVPVAANPADELFLDSHANSPKFQDLFLGQVGPLADATNANQLGLSTEDKHNEAESVSQRIDVVYSAPGHTSPNFRGQIAGQIDPASGLSVDNILDRATTQTCAGCHRLSAGRNLGPGPNGLVWPQDAGFVHVTEGGFLSAALTGTFLPFRRTVLDKFIAERCDPNFGPLEPVDEERTISGRPVESSN